jgi:hypothetical protein
MAQNTGRMKQRVLVSTLSVLCGTAAHAGYYPGHIDPGGTGSVPGFIGDTVFNIPNGCLPGGSFTGWLATTNNVGGSGGCGTATVYSADIDLYSFLATDPPVPGTVLGTFSLAEIDFWDILGVYSLNGHLAGVDTNAMGPETGTGDYDGRPFWLQFASGFCQFGCIPPGTDPSGLASFAGLDPAWISLDRISNLSNLGTVIFGDQCDTPQGCVVVPAVPEPGTLSLLLGALGGGWLARRRKRNASA